MGPPRQPVQVDEFGKSVSLDENVFAKLPKGSKILSVTPSGRSFWVTTVKIRFRLPNGEECSFFKKGAPGDIGRSMMIGAFQAESALYAVIPDSVPKPVAFGTYTSDPNTHFYLCEFVEMLDDVPTPRSWAATVAALHMKSMGKSPTGQFGFPVVTHLANVPVNNMWNSSWETFWAQQMKSLLDQDLKIHGLDPEFERLKEQFFSRPCLIHSDLWPDNIKPKADSDELCMVDACAYWGHNEADLGICRNPKYRLGPSCMRAYWKHIPVSEPEADFDGRNAIYALKFHILLSIMHSKDERFRTIAINEMRDIVEKVVTQYAGRNNL